MPEHINNKEILTSELIKNSFESLYLIEIQSGNCTEYSLDSLEPIQSQDYEQWLIGLTRKMFKSDTVGFFAQMELTQICNQLKEKKSYVVYYRLLENQVSHEYEFGIFYLNEEKKMLVVTCKEIANDVPGPIETASNLAYVNEKLCFLLDHVVEDIIEVEVKTGNCHMYHGNKKMCSFSTLKEQILWWADNLIAPEEREAYIAEFDLENLVNVLRANNNCHRSIYTTREENGSRSLSIVCSLFRKSYDGQEEYIFAYAQDVSQFKEQEYRNKQLVDISQQLLSLSQTEMMTGLYNKTAAEKFIMEYIGSCKKEKAGTLLLFDIDHFKDFNDQYGHQVGDFVLKYVSKSMQEIFRSDDILCRWGGDEFMIFMRNVYQKKIVESRIQRLRLRMQQCSRNSTSFKISFSIGGAVAKKDIDFKTLFAQCDKLLYQVKKQGRDGFILYEDKD